MNRTQVSSYRKTNVRSFVYLDRCPDGNTRPVYENVQTHMTAQSSYYQDCREMNQYGVTSVIRRRRITKIVLPQIVDSDFGNYPQLDSETFVEEPSPSFLAIEEAPMYKSESCTGEHAKVADSTKVEANADTKQDKTLDNIDVNADSVRTKRKRITRKIKSLESGPTKVLVDRTISTPSDSQNSVHSTVRLVTIKKVTSKCLSQVTAKSCSNEPSCVDIKNKSQRMKNSAESTNNVQTSEKIDDFKRHDSNELNFGTNDKINKTLQSKTEIGLSKVPSHLELSFKKPGFVSVTPSDVFLKKQKVITCKTHRPCLGVTIKEPRNKIESKKQWTLFSFLNKKRHVEYGENHNNTDNKSKSGKMSSNEMTNNSWVFTFLTNAHPGKALHVRWNNNNFKNSNSFINKLFESACKDVAYSYECSKKCTRDVNFTKEGNLKNKKLSRFTINFMCNMLDYIFKKHAKTSENVLQINDKSLEVPPALHFSRNILVHKLRTCESKNSNEYLNLYSKEGILKSPLNSREVNNLNEGYNGARSEEQIFNVVEYDTIPCLDSKKQCETLGTLKTEFMDLPQKYFTSNDNILQDNKTKEKPIEAAKSLMPKKSDFASEYLKKSCNDLGFVGMDLVTVSTSASVQRQQYRKRGKVYIFGTKKKFHAKKLPKCTESNKNKSQKRQKTMLSSIIKPKYNKQRKFSEPQHKSFETEFKSCSPKCINVESTYCAPKSQTKIKQKQQHTQCDKDEFQNKIRMNAKDSVQVYKKRQLYTSRKKILECEGCKKSKRNYKATKTVKHTNTIACSCSINKDMEDVMTLSNNSNKQKHKISPSQGRMKRNNKSVEASINAILTRTQLNKNPQRHHIAFSASEKLLRERIHTGVLTKTQIKSTENATHDFPQLQNDNALTYSSSYKALYHRSVPVKCTKVFSVTKTRHIRIDAEATKPNLRAKAKNLTEPSSSPSQSRKSILHLNKKTTKPSAHKRRNNTKDISEQGKMEACGLDACLAECSENKSKNNTGHYIHPCPTEPICSYTKKTNGFSPFNCRKKKEGDTKDSRVMKGAKPSALTRLKNLYFHPEPRKSSDGNKQRQYVVSPGSSRADLLNHLLMLLNQGKNNRNRTKRYSKMNETLDSLSNKLEDCHKKSLPHNSHSRLYDSVKSFVSVQSLMSLKSNGMMVYRSESSRSDGEILKVGKPKSKTDTKLDGKAEKPHSCKCVTGKIRRKLEEVQVATAAKPKSRVSYCKSCKQNNLKNSGAKMTNMVVPEPVLVSEGSHCCYSNATCDLGNPINLNKYAPKCKQGFAQSSHCCNSSSTCDPANAENNNTPIQQCRQGCLQSGHCCYSKSTCNINNPINLTLCGPQCNQGQIQSNQCNFSNSTCDICLHLIPDGNNSDDCFSDVDMVKNVVIVIGDEKQGPKKDSKCQSKAIKCKPRKSSIGEIEYSCELFEKEDEFIKQNQTGNESFKAKEKENIKSKGSCQCKLKELTGKRENSSKPFDTKNEIKESDKKNKSTSAVISVSTNLAENMHTETENKEIQCCNPNCSSHCFMFANQSKSFYAPFLEKKVISQSFAVHSKHFVDQLTNTHGKVNQNQCTGICKCNNKSVSDIGKEIFRDVKSKVRNYHRLITNYAVVKPQIHNQQTAHPKTLKEKKMEVLIINSANDLTAKSIFNKENLKKNMSEDFIELDGILIKGDEKLLSEIRQKSLILMNSQSIVCFDLQCSESIITDLINKSSESIIGADIFMRSILSKGSHVLQKSGPSTTITHNIKSVTDTIKLNLTIAMYPTEDVLGSTDNTVQEKKSVYEESKEIRSGDENVTSDDKININVTITHFKATSENVNSALSLTKQATETLENIESKPTKTDVITNASETLQCIYAHDSKKENDAIDEIGLLDEITSLLTPKFKPVDVSNDNSNYTVYNVTNSCSHNVTSSRTIRQMQTLSQTSNKVTEQSSTKEYTHNRFCDDFTKTMNICKKIESFIGNVMDIKNIPNIKREMHSPIDTEYSEELVTCLAEYASTEQSFSNNDRSENIRKFGSGSSKNTHYDGKHKEVLNREA